MSGEPTLHHLRFSHFNEKGRWGLDYKRVAHRRVTEMPGPHPLRSRRLGGAGTLPLLELADGSVISDSTDLLAWADENGEGPPLLPADPAERRRALELEDYFDEELGPPIRSAVFAALLPDRKATVAVTMQGLGKGAHLFTNAAYPLVRLGISRSLAASEGGGREGRTKTVAALDRLEQELGGGDYLVGDAFSGADLTAAALFSPLAAPPEFPYETPDPWPPTWEEFRSGLADRPGLAWVTEMYRRHRGSSAEVA